MRKVLKLVLANAVFQVKEILTYEERSENIRGSTKENVLNLSHKTLSLE